MIVGIGVSDGIIVPGSGVVVGVGLGGSVFDGVNDGVRVADGGAVLVGAEVLVEVGVFVGVDGGGLPATLKKSTWYQSNPKNNCT